MPQNGQSSNHCTQEGLSKPGPVIRSLPFVDPVSRALSAVMLLMRVSLVLVAILWFGPAAAETLEIPITSGTDDGEENGAGSVTLTSTDDGNSETFTAGDTFFVAKGTRCIWEITETLRKYYLIAA